MAGNTFISKDLSKRGRLTLKGIILLFIILASFSFQETLAEGTTETYNEFECEKLRAFLGLANGQSTNGDILDPDYDPGDPENWIGVYWSDGDMKRVISISWADAGLVGGLDMGGFTEIRDLSVQGNKLTGLDVSGCENLELLCCDNNEISSLTIRDCQNLLVLYCNQNNLTRLDVSDCESLELLDCSDNEINELISGDVYSLMSLNCVNNKLGEIDLSNYLELRAFLCSDNLLSELDLGNNINLEELDCSNNRLNALDLSKNTELLELDCSNNQLNTLDLSNNILLRELNCSNNGLSDLNLASNWLLKLDCSQNHISVLDLSNLSRLEELNCSYNSLSELKPGSNRLTKLYCDFNQISELDLSQTGGLEILSCSSNQLTFSKLPLQSITEYSYSPQADLSIGVDGRIAVNTLIDLSREAMIGEEATEYTWLDDKGTVLRPNIIDRGLFIFDDFDERFIGQTIYCEMRNAEFPDLVLKTTELVVCPLPPEVTSQPEDYNCSLGESASFYIEAYTSVGEVHYQWQFSLNKGKTWSNLEEETGDSLTIAEVTEEESKKIYRCVVKTYINGIYSDPVCSAPAGYNLIPLPEIISHPGDIITESGAEISFYIEVAPVSEGTLSFQWQVSTDEGESWSDVNGAVESTYLLKNIIFSYNGNQYRCLVVNTVDGIDSTPVYSEKAVLTVLAAPYIITQPDTNYTVSDGDSISFEVEGRADNGLIVYRWQMSTDNGETWADLEEAEERIYTIENVSYELSGNLYRCVIMNSMDGVYTTPIYSNEIRLSVVALAVIKADPEDCTVTAGDTAVFRIEAESIDEGTLSYRWEVSSDGGQSWIVIEGATESEYRIEGVSSTDNGRLYRCLIVNTVDGVSSAPVVSKAVLLTVETDIRISFIKPDSGNDENNPVNISSGSLVIARINGDIDSISKVIIRVDDNIEEEYPLSGDTIYYLLPANLAGGEYHMITIKLIGDAGQELASESVQFYWLSYRRGFGFGRFDFGEEE